MIFSSKEKFDKWVHEKVYEKCEQLYIIMHTGYSMKEMLNDAYSIEVCEPYFESSAAEDTVMWFDDWYEGQQYIEVYDWYTESELLFKLRHLSHNEGLDDYVE